MIIEDHPPDLEGLPREAFAVTGSSGSFTLVIIPRIAIFASVRSSSHVLGARADGTATRWMFTEITPRSFHWLGDALAPDGKTWQREGEFLATRAP